MQLYNSASWNDGQNPKASTIVDAPVTSLGCKFDQSSEKELVAG